MGNLKDKYCIVGVGETAFTRSSGRSTLSMGVEAVKKAMEDAGLKPSEVDGMMSYSGNDSVASPVLAQGLGIKLNFFMDVQGGGSSIEALVGLAMGAIEAGMCRTMVLFRSMNGYTEVRIGGTGARASTPVTGEDAFLRSYGWGSPAQNFSFAFCRHMMEYGTTNEQLAQVKVAYSEHASNNPKAFYKRRLTVDDVLNSRWIVKPAVHLLDACVETDNAVAIIVTSAERARYLKQKPVYIMSVVGRVTRGLDAWFGHYQLAPITHAASHNAAAMLWRNAGVGPEDMDFTSCYDAFTYVNLLLFEGYGFCKPGEGGDYVSSGIIKLGGKRPSNTSGGHLCECYTHGVNMLIEDVRQLRGTVDDYCPNWKKGEHTYDYSEGHCRAIKDPELAACMGWGTVGMTSALVLRKSF